MVNYKFLKKLMVVGERNVLSKLVKYTELGTSASLLLKEMFSGDKSKFEAINDKIMGIEKEGDLLSMKLQQEITGGAISSNLMDNLSILIETCDDILDKSYYLSREVKRMSQDYLFSTDEAVEATKQAYETFCKMLDKNVTALVSVRTMFTSDDFSQIKKSRAAIEVLEEEVDELKDELIDDIYRNSNKFPYIVFYHLTGVTHKIDDMLDDCEDISDLIQTIFLSVTK